MLEDKKCFEGSEMQKELKKLLKDGILVAHNAKFDIAMLEVEGIKVPKNIDTLRVARYLDKENKIPEYNLQFLRYYLDLEIDAHAHDAEDDVKVMYALFLRLLDKIKEEIPDEEKAIEKMIEISAVPTLYNQFNFGKHVGEKVEDVAKKDKNYLEWLLKSKIENSPDDEDWIYTLKHYLGKLF